VLRQVVEAGGIHNKHWLAVTDHAVAQHLARADSVAYMKGSRDGEGVEPVGGAISN
jgi:hypothetical protein